MRLAVLAQEAPLETDVFATRVFLVESGLVTMAFNAEILLTASNVDLVHPAILGMGKPANAFGHVLPTRVSPEFTVMMRTVDPIDVVPALLAILEMGKLVVLELLAGRALASVGSNVTTLLKGINVVNALRVSSVMEKDAPEEILVIPIPAIPGSSVSMKELDSTDVEHVLGYTGDGQRCTPHRGNCATNPCSPGVTCTETDEAPGYRCGACMAGFTGDGTRCTDINEVRNLLQNTNIA
ncbi:unnamed protein product [Allacma fusca]|uniref:EGF-like domain-containing protein n=1 Tax=Allacma fusca TaxID=39272 RepID=A0A8J2NW59_9HEXA|nr:unnamed protein product [Allacma fusca]